MSTWRDKLILFGSVLDKEGGATDEGEEVGPVKPTGGDVAKKGAHSAKKGSDEIVRSAFYNDMYSFDLGRKRWYKLDLKKKKMSTRGEEKVKTRRRQGEEEVVEEEEVEEEDNEEEEEEDNDDDDDDIDHQKGPTNGGGKPSMVEDLALYYYQDGKLVRMEDDEEEEGDVIAGAVDGVSSDIAGAVDGVSSDVAGAVDGVSRVTLNCSSGDVGNIKSGKVTAKKNSVESAAAAVTAKELISAATVARRDAEERERVRLARKEAKKIADAEAALLQQKPSPLGRIRAGMWCVGNWLYIYGGLREETIKLPSSKSIVSFGSGAKKPQTASLEKEITLDDMWRIDLRERLHWEMLLPGTMHTHAWRQEPESDDEDEEEEEEEEEDDEEDDEEGESEEEEGEEEIEESGSGFTEGGGRFARASHSKLSPEALRLRRLRDKLALEDAERTPVHTEELRDFFARSQEFWIGEWLGSGSMKNGTVLAGKEVRHKAFKLAKGRYEQCWDLISELREAEEALKAVEEAAAAERLEKLWIRQKIQ